MPGIKPRVLLVEGSDDKRVIPEVIERNGVPWGSRGVERVHIEAVGSVSELLEVGVIDTWLKASGLQALGIMLDIDDDLQSRWQSVRARLAHTGVELPHTIPASGFCGETSGGIRLGVWLMPDNTSRGMLETFLEALRPTENPALLDYARQACTEAKALGASFKLAHEDKAAIHCWLAWQDPPGRQLHDAIKQRMLDPRSTSAQPFVEWFCALFNLVRTTN